MYLNGKDLTILSLGITTVIWLRMLVPMVRGLPSDYPKKTRLRKRTRGDWVPFSWHVFVLVLSAGVLFFVWKEVLTSAHTLSQPLWWKQTSWHDPILDFGVCVALIVGVIVYVHSSEKDHDQRIAGAIKAAMPFVLIDAALIHHPVIAVIVTLALAGLITKSVWGERERHEADERMLKRIRDHEEERLRRLNEERQCRPMVDLEEQKRRERSRQNKEAERARQQEEDA